MNKLLYFRPTGRINPRGIKYLLNFHEIGRERTVFFKSPYVSGTKKARWESIREDYYLKNSFLEGVEVASDSLAGKFFVAKT